MVTNMQAQTCISRLRDTEGAERAKRSIKQNQGSSSPTAEAAPSNSVQCRFESGDEYKKICPGSSADRALDYGSRCRRFDSFSGHNGSTGRQGRSEKPTTGAPAMWRQGLRTPRGRTLAKLPPLADRVCVGCTTAFQAVRASSSLAVGSRVAASMTAVRRPPAFVVQRFRTPVS